MQKEFQQEFTILNFIVLIVEGRTLLIISKIGLIRKDFCVKNVIKQFINQKMKNLNTKFNRF